MSTKTCLNIIQFTISMTGYCLLWSVSWKVLLGVVLIVLGSNIALRMAEYE